jgi:FAD/FMN-containing dehydrogenase
MSKVAHYLQQHLVGEVMTSADMRRYFSTDGGVFAVMPAMIVYPRNENDVRKAARFTWQLAERGRAVPITARGLGTDQSGAAVGPGVIMVFPAHMNRIVELDGKSGSVTIEPGINYGRLQQTLHTHGRYLPPFPASIEYCTVGGAIANNASGEKSLKYGSTREYVKNMRVVLANGEVIDTRRLGKKELSKKLGLPTFEGEVYRELDKLLDENSELLKTIGLNVTKNSAGYALNDIKRKDGSFDLTPLLVGSQGTLGIVTEATLTTEPYNADTTLMAVYFDNLTAAQQAILDIRKLADMPCAMEMVDRNLLDFVHASNPNLLNGIIEPPFPEVVMLVEFDSANDRVQKRMVKKASKILDKYEVKYTIERDADKKEALWKIRHSAAAVVSHVEGNTKALPIIEDGIVPVDKLQEYLQTVYEMFKHYGLRVAMWGHAGDANLHLQPFLDLAQVGDRQKVFRLIDDYYNLVISLGGSTSGEHNDGRLRGPYLAKLYGDQIYDLFRKTKAIFDPHNILNPGVKIDVTLDMIKPLLRTEYSMDHLYDHLPRT